MEISIDNVERIEVEKTDGGKTTLAVIGGIVLLPVVIIVGTVGLILSLEQY